VHVADSGGLGRELRPVGAGRWCCTARRVRAADDEPGAELAVVPQHEVGPAAGAIEEQESFLGGTAWLASPGSSALTIPARPSAEARP